MCLIVVKDNNKGSFSIADFKASQAKNSDGTGIMYVENGRVQVERVMGEAKNHLELYYKHMHRPQFVLHHRMGTHGAKSIANVHPFKVLSIDEGDAEDLYMVHNGVLNMSKFTALDKSMSDTALFVYEYLTPLLRQFPGILEFPQFQIMLHDFIGTYNKLTFLNSAGRVFIFNKEQGDIHNECWLSNKHSIAQSKTETWNNSKRHGMYYNDNYGNAMDDVTDYYSDSGVKVSENWHNANQMKAKSEHTMTKMDINELVLAIDQYAGMAEKELEDLFISEPHLVYDMMNTLSNDKDTLDVKILDKEAMVVAEQLHDLLQDYSKKKAA